MFMGLHLPYSVCYPATLLARRYFPIKISNEIQDQEKYFAAQRNDTVDRYRRNMDGFDLTGKRVLDIGSGLGGRALGWLELGAQHVVNVDINRQELEVGRKIVDDKYPELAHKIDFRHPDEMTSADHGDVAIFFDSFEHLTDPGAVLLSVHKNLVDGGKVWIGSIGWYNHMAGHISIYVPIPWCQVFFSEKALIKTIRAVMRRPDYTPTVWDRLAGMERWNSVETLRDRPGEPLNMLSLRRIRQVLAKSPFKVSSFKTFGFAGKGRGVSKLLAPLARVPLLDEFFHSYYTAVLEKEPADQRCAPTS